MRHGEVVVVAGFNKSFEVHTQDITRYLQRVKQLEASNAIRSF